LFLFIVEFSALSKLSLLWVMKLLQLLNHLSGSRKQGHLILFLDSYCWTIGKLKLAVVFAG
jgi:hypothetical protein